MVFFQALFFILGTVFGSFFMALADRLCAGEFRKNIKSLLISRSQCEYCGHKLAVIDLIPIVSYIRNRQKCRFCNSTLSIKYPVSEIAAGIFALALYNQQGLSVSSALYFFIPLTIAAILYTDIRKMIIPDLLLIILLILVCAYRITNGFSIDHLWGAAFLGGIFLIILFIFPGAFGGGDIKYSAVIGLFFGFHMSVIVLEAALISGSIFGTGYAVYTGKGMRIKIPFGPFLTIGAFITYFYGTDILLMYNSLFY